MSVQSLFEKLSHWVIDRNYIPYFMYEYKCSRLFSANAKNNKRLKRYTHPALENKYGYPEDRIADCKSLVLLKMLRWRLERRNKWGILFQKLIESNNKWRAKDYSFNPDNRKEDEGVVDILDYLKSIDRLKIERHSLNLLVTYGDLTLLKWMVRHGAKLSTETMEQVVGNNSLQIIQWMVQQGVKLSWKVLCTAALDKEIKVVEWIMKNKPEGWDEGEVDQSEY